MEDLGKIAPLGNKTHIFGLGFSFSVIIWCTPERRVLQSIIIGRLRLPPTATSGVHELISASSPFGFTN